MSHWTTKAIRDPQATTDLAMLATEAAGPSRWANDEPVSISDIRTLFVRLASQGCGIQRISQPFTALWPMSSGSSDRSRARSQTVT
jgi:hypothetical protein